MVVTDIKSDVFPFLNNYYENDYLNDYCEIVDAFTNKPFAGNPAAVCVMDSWHSEESMMKLAMEKAFGVRPIKAVLGLDLVCVFESEKIVRNMNPKQELLLGIEGRIQNVTASGTDTDCVSRSFCPKLSIAEDPVWGSAHCQIAAYWSHKLGKKGIYAYQASKRGGYLHCTLQNNDRITISGEAALVAISEIVAAL